MSKREKIIVGAVIVVAVLAVYVQFLVPSGGEARRPDLQSLKQELASFVTSTSAVVAQAKPDERALYAIARAQVPWERDPFLASDAPLDIVKAEEADAVIFPAFTYSGFIGQGQRRLAVIDGIEYEEGQELDPPGFVLKKVFPEKVIIGIKGKQQETTVMLVEEVLGWKRSGGEGLDSWVPNEPGPTRQREKALWRRFGATP